MSHDEKIKQTKELKNTAKRISNFATPSNQPQTSFIQIEHGFCPVSVPQSYPQHVYPNFANQSYPVSNLSYYSHKNQVCGHFLS